MISIYNIDCMEGMKKYRSNHFDWAIVDPPYGIGRFASGQRNKNISHQKIHEWNHSIPSSKYFEELKRVSRNQIIWGANYYPGLCGGRLIWYKHVKVANFSKCEIAYVSTHKKVEYIDSVWQNINRKEHIIHPCQKPVNLYVEVLQRYVSKGSRILDTHLGSGSIAVACYDLNLSLEGYEIDPVYFNRAKTRLNQHKKQLSLFEDLL